MKTRLLGILLTVMFLIPNFAYSADGRLCQQGVFVVFGNGVWNDKEDADASRDLLAWRLESHISGTDLDGLITYISHLIKVDFCNYFDFEKFYVTAKSCHPSSRLL